MDRAVPIRRLLGTDDELDCLEPLWLALHRHHRSTVTAVPTVGDEGESWRRRRAWYRRMIDEDDGFVLIAEADGGVVGYAFTRVQRGPDDTLDLGLRWAQLVTLSVLPGHRGRGVGTALMDALGRELDNMHIANIEVDVMQGNSRAQGFYERQGFVVGQTYLYRVAR